MNVQAPTKWEKVLLHLAFYGLSLVCQYLNQTKLKTVYTGLRSNNNFVFVE